jgi:cobalt-zinc-cadmium efflux system membrane fusion protein
MIKNKIYFSLLLLLVSCGNDTVKKEDKETEDRNAVTLNTEQIRNAGITFGTPKLERIGLTLFANGMIEVPPQNKTVISLQIGGFIKSINVLDGMSVTKGQTLLTIEHPDLIQLQQDYLEIMSSLEFLQAEVERQRKLTSQEAGTLKNLQEAKAEFAAALARKSGLKAKLQMVGVNISKLDQGDLQRTISVTAPFSGVVTKLSADVGAYANPTDHLLEVIDLKHAHAEVTVFEKDIKHLKIGQKVRLMFATDNEPLNASVFLIGKEIGTDRTVKVHCHLDKENSNIAPGTYFKAAIITGEKEAYCIPSEAIVELNGKNVVFFEQTRNNKASTFVPEEVRIISTDETKTAIKFVDETRLMTEPLVVKGAYELMSVMVMKEEQE